MLRAYIYKQNIYIYNRQIQSEDGLVGDNSDQNILISDKENIGIISNVIVEEDDNYNNIDEIVSIDKLESDSSNLSKILKLPESMTKNHQDDSEIEKQKRSKIEAKDEQLAREQEELLKLLSQDNNKILQGFNHLQEFIKQTDSTKSLNVSESQSDNDDNDDNLKGHIIETDLDNYSSGIVPQSQG